MRRLIGVALLCLIVPSSLAAQSPDDRHSLERLRDSLAAVTDTVDLIRLEMEWIDIARVDRGNALPLFPYRVQFLRKQSEPGGEEQGTAEFKPILTLELFEVRTGVHFDPALFRYQAGDQDVADHTQIFLTHLGVSE